MNTKRIVINVPIVQYNTIKEQGIIQYLTVPSTIRRLLDREYPINIQEDTQGDIGYEQRLYNANTREVLSSIASDIAKDKDLSTKEKLSLKKLYNERLSQS